MSRTQHPPPHHGDAVPPRADLPEVPDALVRAGARDALLVVVGAGVSMPAPTALRSWKDLISSLIELASAEHVDTAEASALAEEGELISAAQLLGQPPLDRDWLARHVWEAVGAGAAKPNATHFALARLAAHPGVRLVTTNYDRALERALADVLARKPTVLSPSSLNEHPEALDHRGCLLKLHGEPVGAMAGDWIFTQDDYDRIDGPQRTLWKSWLERHVLPDAALLFVGYSHGDRHIERVWSPIKQLTQGKLAPYWVELSLGRPAATGKAKALGLKLIGLRSWEDLPGWLDRLGMEILAERKRNDAPLFVRQSQPDSDRVHGVAEAAARGQYDREQWQAAAQTYRSLIADKTSRAEVLGDGHEADELRRHVNALRLSLGGCLANLGRTEEAVEALSEAMGGPLSSDNWAHLAAIWLGLQRPGDARRAAERVDEGTLRARHLAWIDHFDGGPIPEPDPQADTNNLWNVAVVAFANAGRAAAVFQYAVHAIEHYPEELDPVTRYFYLRAALASHAIQVPPCTEPLSTEQARDAVRRLDEWAEQVRFSERDPTRSDWLAASLLHRWGKGSAYAPWVERADQARARWQSAGHEPPEEEPSPREPEWYDTLRTAGAEFEEGDTHEAVARLESLRRRLEPSVPADVLLTLAQQLVRVGGADQAQEHGRRGFNLLPTRQGRYIWGDVLYLAGQSSEAWEVLEPLADGGDERLLSRLAELASQRADGSSLRWIRRWIDAAERDRLRPVDRIRIHMNAGSLCLRAGQREEAWRYLSRVSTAELGDLSADERAGLAQLSSFASPIGDAEARERLVELARAICPDVAHHDRSARVYTALYFATLQQPTDLPAPRLDHLAARGVVASLTTDELAHHLRQRTQWTVDALKLVAREALDWAAVSDLIGVSIASLFAKDEPSWLVPAVLPPEWTSAPPSELFVGLVELHLLCELDLISELRRWLGDAGRVLLEPHVLARVLEEPKQAQLRADAQRAASLVAGVDRLEAAVNSDRVDVAPEGSVRAAADARGARVVSREWGDTEGAGSGYHFESLVCWLWGGGHIHADAYTKLMRLPAPAPSPPEGDWTPGPLVLPALVVEEFARGDALGWIDREGTAGLELAVTRADWRALREARAVAQRSLRAARRAEGVASLVREGLRQGWIRGAGDLVPASTSRGQSPREQIERAHQRHLARFEAIGEPHAGRAQLVAESPWLGGHDYALEWARATGLPLHERARVLLAPERAMMRVGASLSLPQLVRATKIGRPRWSALRRLVEWGFADAMDPEWLDGLQTQFPGLGGAEPRRLLREGFRTWGAAQPLSRILSQESSVGSTIAGWLGSHVEDPPAHALLPLLEAVEDCGGEGGSAPLAHVLVYVLGAQPRVHQSTWRWAGGTLADGIPEASDPIRLELDEQAPAMRLLREVFDWCKMRHTRIGALTWALRLYGAGTEMSLHGAEGAEDWARLRMGPLSLALVQSFNPIRHGVAHLDDSVLGELAVWSATVPGDALAVTVALSATREQGPPPTLEGILQRAADAWQRRMADAEVLYFVVTQDIELDGHPIKVCAPVLALLFRASPELAARAARSLANRVSREDNALATALRALAEDPSANEARRRVTRLWRNTPARDLSSEPARFARWFEQARPEMSRPTDLPELRALLSEAPCASMEDRLARLLALQQQDSQDAVEQFIEAMLVPGLHLIQWSVLWSLLPLEGAASWAQMLYDALARPEHATAGELSAAVVALTSYAGGHAKLSLGPDSDAIDLRLRLPSLIEGALRAARQPAPAGGASYAAVEPSALRLAMEHVLNLPEVVVRSVADHEILWLAWRWAQWMARCYRSATPEAQAEAARVWRQVDPGVAAPGRAGPELFEPRRFGEGGVNLRVAALLSGLHMAREVAREAAAWRQRREDQAAGAADGECWLPGSAGLFEVLRELASAEITPLEAEIRHLDGAHTPLAHNGPCTVPDLAMAYLLLAEADEFMRMDPTARQRWIAEATEQAPGHPTAPARLAELVRMVAALHVAELTPAERGALAAHCARGDADPASRFEAVYATALRVGLVRTRDLEWSDALAGSVLDVIRDPDLPPAPRGAVLSTLPELPDGIFESAVGRWTELLAGDPAALGQLARGLVEVAARAAPGALARASAALTDLAAHPSLESDAELRARLGQLGLAPPKRP